MRTPARPRTRATLRLLAVPAAVAVLMGASLPAQAQFFTSSGANFSFPTNFFPLAQPIPQTLDFTGNSVVIGSNAAGSFDAFNGALLKADLLDIGEGGTGAGVVTLSGPGTSVMLGGTGNRLEVGNWGTGSLSVSAGAVLDASTNAGACSAPGCFNYVGGLTGSTGVLTVTDSGSQVRASNAFVVGQVFLFTQATDGLVAGTPGADVSATVNVLNGGSMFTENVIVGVGRSRQVGTGTEQAFGSITIDGAGSRWVATRNTVTNTAASFIVGNLAGGHGAVVVKNGGQLIVDGTGGSASSFDGMNIGSSGGTGSVTVTGIGSSLLAMGNNPFIQVGRSGATGQGSLDVLAGATAQALFMNVGRDGASGSVLIDGAGSKISLIGVGTPGATGAAGATLGQNGGTGHIVVSNGASLLISDGGANSTSTFGPYLHVGREAGSNGSLTISGDGSKVQITSTSITPAPGSPDNFNPYMTVGTFSGATGSLVINNGGKLLLNGNALSTSIFPRGTNLVVGGNNDTDLGGNGSALVSGPGSEIRLSGSDTFIAVGRGPGSVGQLTVANQASVTATTINVGRAGGTGTLTVDGASLNMAGQRTDDQTNGAALTIGNRGGTGVATVTNGSHIDIANLGDAGASLNVGGTGPNPLGNGTLTVSGGSTISVTAASGLATFSVGRDGSGNVSFTQNSSLEIGNGAAHVGRFAGGVGALSIASGSSLMVGTLGIGGSSDTVAGGTGTASVSGAGSVLSAGGASGFIGVGRGGTGTLAVTEQGNVSGIVLNVGRAAGGVGTMTVGNATIDLSGQQTASGFGATLVVGNSGGTGAASITNGSVVNITNMGTGGANLYVGGTPVAPLGNGSLNVSNSQINLVAAAGQAGAPGLATVAIGHDGNGTATFSNSRLNAADGSLIIAGQTGSTGTMTLNTDSVVNAGYVGVGATKSAVVGQQNLAGAGHLVINNSTVNTTTFEIGAQGVLSGDGGIINASGDVIVGGTIDPGNSPGRIRINCNLISLAGSNIVIDIAFNGTGYDFDELIIGSESTFALDNLQVVFNFLGDTDPMAFAKTGLLDLDTFLRAGDPDHPTDLGYEIDSNNVGLSELFADGQSWGDVIKSEITAVSSRFDVTELELRSDGSFVVVANAVPEPPTWVLMLVGLMVMGAYARTRRRGVGRSGTPLRAASAA